MKDFYNILGVSDNATDDQIKKAYRKLAIKYHPDKNRGDKQAEERFKEVSEANDTLSDKNKRAQYDQIRKYGGGFGGFQQGRPGGGFGAGQQGFDFNDLSSIFGNSGGFGSFADIFSSIFGDNIGGFGTSAGETRAPSKGDDLFSDISVPFGTAARGGKIHVRLNLTENCDVCRGQGIKPGGKQTKCPDCDGRGMITFMQGNFAVSRPCPRCFGRGVIKGDQCDKCNGAGTTAKRREIAVNIPPGSESGRKIRLKGLGNPGKKSGPNGDLYLRLEIKGDHFFWREGINIFCNIVLNLDQAIEGTRIRVRTINGKKAELKIPPKTKAGSKLRLKGLGLAQKGAKGDQIVVIDIKKPTNMSDNQKELYNELAGA
jgi:molecular chaperone DnaJ